MTVKKFTHRVAKSGVAKGLDNTGNVPKTFQRISNDKIGVVGRQCLGIVRASRQTTRTGVVVPRSGRGLYMSRLRSLHRADENRQRPHQRQQYHQEGYEEEPPHDGLMVGAVGFRIRRLISLPNQESLLRIMQRAQRTGNRIKIILRR